MEEQEIWKDIFGYERLYKISNLGRVLSLSKRNGHGVRPDFVMKPKVKRSGYLFVGLSKNKEVKYFHVHRLVALHFLPKSELEQVNHIDGDKSNNRYLNLEWISPLDNVRHAWNTNLMKSHLGEKHFHSKLTNFQVREIKNMLKNTTLTHAKIGLAFGISAKHVQKINRGYIWSHITV